MLGQHPPQQGGMNQQQHNGLQQGQNGQQQHPQQQQQQQQQQMGGINGNGPQTNGGASNDAASSSQPDYHLAGILHYLQSEWRRYEKDRNEWEIERAEMRARIALLEGERRAVENLKTDLMRRVKMLEYALRQERSKHLSGSVQGSHVTLKNPALIGLERENSMAGSGRSSPAPLSDTESNAPGSTAANHQRGISTSALTFSTLGAMANGGPASAASSNISRRSTKDLRSREKSRDYLKQCLQEISYLTSASTLNPLPERAAGSMLFPGHAAQSGPARPRKIMVDDMPSSGDDGIVPKAGATDLPGDIPPIQEDPQDAGMAPMDPQTPAVESEPSRSTSPPPFATEERYESTNEAGESAQLFERGRDRDGWSAKDLLRFKEREQGSSSYQDSDAADQEDEDAAAALQDEQAWKLKKTVGLHREEVLSLAWDSESLQLFTGSQDGSIRATTFDGVALSAALGNPAAVARGSALGAVTLEGHTSAVTSLAVSTTRRKVYSAACDSTLNVWSIPHPVTPARTDLTSVSPVMEDQPSPSVKPLTSLTVPSAIVSLFLLSSRNGDDSLLATAAMDGLVRIYSIVSQGDPELIRSFDYFGSDPADEAAIEEEKEMLRQEFGGLPLPSCFSQIHFESENMAVGWSNGVVKIFEIESSRCLQVAEGLPSSSIGNSSVTCIVAHPTLPLLFTGHEDKFIKVTDLRSTSSANVNGETKSPTKLDKILAMHGHKDMLSALDIDPAGLKLISGGFDGVVRIWDVQSLIRKFTEDGTSSSTSSLREEAESEDNDDEDESTLRLVQEIDESTSNFTATKTTTGRRAGSSILTVQYHKSKPFFASSTSGLGGVVRIYG